MKNDGSNQQDEFVIHILEQEDAFSALFAAKKLARQIGFNNADEVLIATVVSELSTNIIRYAGSGKVTLKVVTKNERTGLEIIADDEGPGIPDIELAMTDNYSTTKDSLGLGLSSLKRIMNEFKICSNPNEGTKIIARKWRT